MKKTLITLALITASLTAQAATQVEIDQALAPVKTPADLQQLLNAPSPLDALAGNLPLFLDSITGLAQGQNISFDKQLLSAPLTATEVYHILALFGQQTHIAQYQGAAIVTASDTLLLNNTALPVCATNAPIELMVTLDSQKQAQFHYAQAGIECDGNVELTENATITYQLVPQPTSPKGLRLTGAGFTNPFDGHIETVSVSADGQSIQLQNNIQNSGVSKYQFIFATEENDLLLVSPDPEITNRPQN
ncbi:DP-EP family protein [Shewanella sp. CG12_big_fil_rev_8_21_14_0_65_47_15]|uniref:DP-EP family protein n=1 Tax=Shewanella sp. CG12_big_fil_rev_8_21_14_0_65_47_15 TaxID=1975537 RepID=UPI000CAE6915|nr:DP-EP family protein [Shewanella sp. CG12_big_fil_rev_8_21_14_0_65_47_15]PIW62343.1 MAG: hypothetical protein COW15_03785 [Shewanella sp. CG12_big_fil_rev_8_21_14_0_65_47_15]